MAKKLINWKTKGMNRDTSPSAFSPEFAFENRNIRLSTNEGNTQMSWVNERGTKKVILACSIEKEIEDENNNKKIIYEYKKIDSLSNGIPVGTAVINHKLVVFTAKDQEELDHIFLLKKAPKGSITNDVNKESVDFIVDTLYEGNLGLDSDYPLEILVSYESEIIQKVYWTDNFNPPRVINIASGKSYTSIPSSIIDTIYDFAPTLKLQETVSVEKVYGSGEFPAGVIQYAFTYYNKYMQESAVFYVTPLQCISFYDRGGSPEDTVANAFKITINKVDTNFEYLRIYSILRTSKNTTPLCKRVQDILIEGKSKENVSITFTDTGTKGETIDPTELLYKESRDIRVGTIEQKDNTLFFGNIKEYSSSLPSTPKELLSPDNVFADLPIDTTNENSNIICTTRVMYENSTASTNQETNKKIEIVSQDTFPYINSIGVSGFKNKEYYRIGIQFQHKTGRWSEPVWLKDYIINGGPSSTINTLTLPQITIYIGKTEEIITPIVNAGYKKARLLMTQPSENDRTILCQGIANACLYRDTSRYIEEENHYINTSRLGNLYGQSSWIFRPKSYTYEHLIEKGADANDGSGAGCVPYSGQIIGLEGMDILESADRNPSPGIKAIEVGTMMKYAYINEKEESSIVDDPYKIDPGLITIHSPETIFNDCFNTLDWSNFKIAVSGVCTFNKTFGDIDIQTKTPTIDSGSGFVHKSIQTEGNAALVSGLFYEDFIADDYNTNPVSYGKFTRMKLPVSFPVYMWHKSGSLNNDVVRDNSSAELLKKKICNYHLSYKTEYTAQDKDNFTGLKMAYFNSDELSVVKLEGKVYMGNIDTIITPKYACYKYFVGDPFRKTLNTSFNSPSIYRLGYEDTDASGDSTQEVGLYSYNSDENRWINYDKDVGNKVSDLCSTREGVRIKYKSSPHIVALGQSSGHQSMFEALKGSQLPVVEVYKDYNADELYGGQSTDALKSNIWIPISNPEIIKKGSPLKITSNRGDTWFQRYECLKTYAFTPEDINQVVDIASFMVETHINIDGRYDRNRGQINNLNASPKNFNLINPVYSQLDNFFSYKILDEDAYKNTNYPNHITWSKTKESGADVDTWTNITLASVLEMDGDKGKVTKLSKLNNQLICFQDSGISQILYNENAQISTTAGVPIELANSGKVQGKRYYSNTIGCSNKWSVVQTPGGVYFMDSNKKGIYLFNGELKNLTMQGGMNTWAKQNIPSSDVEWNPFDFNNFVSYYDSKNQEIFFINKYEALVYSEKFGCFTSFYDYGGVPYYSTLDDIGIWIKNEKTLNNLVELWQHQAGDYCNFFDENKGYSMTLVGNQEPLTDKMFTNLEFRACVEGEGTYDEEKNKFSPTLPFDTLEVWNEYQHGILNLSDRNGRDRFTHGSLDGSSSLNRKFRIWRCDMPRDNAPISDEEESKMGIKRFKVRPLDRIRNPWVYIKLSKKVAKAGVLNKVEIHDIVATYFG